VGVSGQSGWESTFSLEVKTRRGDRGALLGEEKRKRKLKMGGGDRGGAKKTNDEKEKKSVLSLRINSGTGGEPTKYTKGEGCGEVKKGENSGKRGHQD